MTSSEPNLKNHLRETGTLAASFDELRPPIREWLYISQGRERWFTAIESFWTGNHSIHTADFVADEATRHKMEKIENSVRRGIENTFHRLSSTVGALAHSMADRHSDIIPKDKTNVLLSIAKNATLASRTARIRGYRGGLPDTSPITALYLECSKEFRESELIEDAYQAGESAAAFTTMEEVVSWFRWAGANGFQAKERLVSIGILRFRRGDILVSGASKFEGERELLNQALSVSDALQSSSVKLNETQWDELDRYSKKANIAWLTEYLKFVSDSPLPPCFQRYLA